ncbi:hypothetical protein RCH14_000849 [Massilia sp. MP_M2]|uniref:hypothetical protein n=1 Tax=Massilia sp. MP_M2 TaxID=3071713 RepID=UPI00319EB409
MTTSFPHLQAAQRNVGIDCLRSLAILLEHGAVHLGLQRRPPVGQAPVKGV